MKKGEVEWKNRAGRGGKCSGGVFWCKNKDRGAMSNLEEWQGTRS